jgi:hypothetical protein
VFGVQIDLVLGTVQPKPDRALSLAAIEVVDKQGLYLLGLVLQLPFHVECLTDMSSVMAGSAVKATLCDGQG